MFKCPVCKTEYTHQDLAKHCAERGLDDTLNAQVGENVLETRWVGDDYARPPLKPGIRLLWKWTYVRDKRIVPFSLIKPDFSGRHHHVAEYKIGDVNKELLQLYPEYADRWEEYASGILLGAAIGPYHYWSRQMVTEWPRSVIGRCHGEYTKEMLDKLRSEGYSVPT